MPDTGAELCVIDVNILDEWVLIEMSFRREGLIFILLVKHRLLVLDLQIGYRGKTVVAEMYVCSLGTLVKS